MRPRSTTRKLSSRLCSRTRAWAWSCVQRSPPAACGPVTQARSASTSHPKVKLAILSGNGRLVGNQKRWCQIQCRRCIWMDCTDQQGEAIAWASRQRWPACAGHACVCTMQLQLQQRGSKSQFQAGCGHVLKHLLKQMQEPVSKPKVIVNVVPQRVDQVGSEAC